MEEDDCEETYKIVTTIRSDSLNSIISMESPLGKALMGKHLDDRVYVKINETYGYYVVISKITKNDDETEAISTY